MFNEIVSPILSDMAHDDMLKFWLNVTVDVFVALKAVESLASFKAWLLGYKY